MNYKELERLYLKLSLYLRSVRFDLVYVSNMTVPATAKMYMNVISKIMIKAID